MIVSSKRTFLQIIHKTPVAEAALKKARHERFEGRVAEAVGLRRVLECLVANESVLVGHNAFQDFVFVWSQFMGVLPDTLEQFCEVVSENFPQYYPTLPRFPLFLLFLLARCDWG
jgi:hypothetical protein